MNRPIIQFHKSNILQLDSLFLNFFSRIESRHEIFIGNQFKIYPSPTDITEALKTPWVIFHKDDSQIVGEIIYQPGPKIDTLTFEYYPEYTELVRHLINDIKIRMNILGFNMIYEGEEPVISQQPKTEEDIDNILSDTHTMKKHYKDYSPPKAKLILEVIPEAWKNWPKFGGQWGPGVISKYCYTNPTTVGRYLKAFHMVGLKAIEVEGETIKIPHRPIKTSKSSNSPSKS